MKYLIFITDKLCYIILFCIVSYFSLVLYKKACLPKVKKIGISFLVFAQLLDSVKYDLMGTDNSYGRFIWCVWQK